MFDLRLVDQLTLINKGKEDKFGIDENGVMRFGNRVCLLGIPELKKNILEEVHRSGLSIHPGDTKMYQNLKKLFWWPGMKNEVAEFVYACLTCKRLKIKH